MSCSTCIEPYNASTRKPHKCAKCEFECCVGCVKQHLLGSHQLPHCMNCKVEWTDDRLRETVSHHWITSKYSEKRKELLFEVEKSLLPNTMIFVERHKLDVQIQTENREVKVLLFDLKRQIHEFNAPSYTLRLSKRNKLLITTIKQTAQQLSFLDNRTVDEIDAIVGISATAIQDASEERRAFIKPCPATDCKGYLSTQYKCGLCGCKSCPKCFEILDTTVDHVCKEENILSADLIRKESKGCPSCGVMIFKISGCDQMWCTSCNTGFSWVTGKVITSIIHNPHYFQWLRTQPAQEGGEAVERPVPLGCVWNGRHNTNITRVSPHLRQYIPDTAIFVYDYIMNVIQSVNHIHGVERPPALTENYEEINRKARIDYLMSDITEKEFKSRCLRHLNQQEFNRALHMIYDMLNELAREIVNSLHPALTPPQIMEKCTELQALIKYYNDNIRQIYDKYKRTGKFKVFLPTGKIEDSWRTGRT